MATEKERRINRLTETLVTPASEVVLRRGKRNIKQPSCRFAQLRGTATVKMSTDEIMALTRGSKAGR